MELTQQIRDGIKLAICSSGGGHAGGSLSVADIMASLYGTVMKLSLIHIFRCPPEVASYEQNRK